MGLDVYVLNATTFSIPNVVMVAISRHSDVPQVVVSAGTSTTFEEAVDKGLRELVIASEMFYYTPEVDFSIESQPVFSLGKIERQLYWKGKDKIKQFEWFISGALVSYESLLKRDIITDDTDQGALKICLEIMKGYGEDYYPVVYYPKNNLQKKLGFYVAQVYIPKAFPFYLYEGYGAFTSDRLKDFALSKNVVEWKINTLPHMFS
jgi:hypothetical protein